MILQCTWCVCVCVVMIVNAVLASIPCHLLLTLREEGKMAVLPNAARRRSCSETQRFAFACVLLFPYYCTPGTSLFTIHIHHHCRRTALCCCLSCVCSGCCWDYVIPLTLHHQYDAFCINTTCGGVVMLAWKKGPCVCLRSCVCLCLCVYLCVVCVRVFVFCVYVYACVCLCVCVLCLCFVFVCERGSNSEYVWVKQFVE